MEETQYDGKMYGRFRNLISGFIYINNILAFNCYIIRIIASNVQLSNNFKRIVNISLLSCCGLLESVIENGMARAISKYNMKLAYFHELQTNKSTKRGNSS